MKVDQQMLMQQQIEQSQNQQQPSYFVWEQHNVSLLKSANYGYGIAISGGLCTSSNGQDSPIYISDVVPGGPAENKLMIDDIILVVNGVNVENVEHSFVLMLLKEAKDFIHLVVKRKINNFNYIASLKQQQQQTLLTTAASMNASNGQSPSMLHHQQLMAAAAAKEEAKLSKRRTAAIQQTAATVMANYQNSNSSNNMAALNGGHQQNANLMASTASVSSLKPIKVTLNRKDKKEVYGVILGCKYYIKDIIPESIAAEEKNLRKGDTLLKINDFNVDQISLADARKIILKTKENKLHLTVRRNNLTATTINGGTHINGDEQTTTTATFGSEQNGSNTYTVTLKAACERNEEAEELSSEEATQQQQQPQPPPRTHSNGGHHHYVNGAGPAKMASGGQQSSGGANYHYQAVNEAETAEMLHQNCGESTEQQQPVETAPEPTQTSTSSLRQLFKPIRNASEPIVYLESSMSSSVSRTAKFFSNKNVVMNCRTVVFARENGIGVRLAGGNKVGIFICDVQYNSPAEKAGLKIADKIIKVNGVDYAGMTREEAVQHILSMQSLIEMVVAHSPDEYEMFAYNPQGADSFYVRAHFNYTSKNPGELSFRINDILHVTDTLYNGVMGKWVANKLVVSAPATLENVEGCAPSLFQYSESDELRGAIPNQINAEKIVTDAQTIEQVSTSSGAGAGPNGSVANSPSSAANSSTISTHTFASIGASARMSLRKKLAGRNALNKRSKSAANSDAEGTGAAGLVDPNVKVSKANTFYGSKYPAYEKVVIREVNFTRPVVIFGPLADVAREKLKSEFPGKFEIPESYNTTPADSTTAAAPVNGGVIKLASIKQIIERGRHCLLDITPNAVDHLNYAQYFPICVYLKAQSRNHTKELRQKYAKNLKAKSSRRLYENALKLQTFYPHLFTATLSLDTNNWFKKLKECIDGQQSIPLWISEDLEQLQQQQQQETPRETTTTTTATIASQHNYELQIQQQQFLAKQQQLEQQQQQFMSSELNRYLFDDNFEFPIYTSTNPAGLSMSGAASSTYSLYEDEQEQELANDNYRGSFAAASESDMKQQLQQPELYTGYNRPQSHVFNGSNGGYVVPGDQAKHHQSTPQSAAVNGYGQMLNRVHSDSNLNMSEANASGFEPLFAGAGQQSGAGQRQTAAQSGVKNGQVVGNNLTSVSYSQIMDKSSSPAMQAYQPKYKKAGANYDYTDQIHHPTGFQQQQQQQVSEWKKYATYSANTLKSLTNGSSGGVFGGLVSDDSNPSMNGLYYHPPGSVKTASSPMKSRPMMSENMFMPPGSLNGDSSTQSQYRRSSNDYVQQSPATSARNSASYSSYKLIKNSQSSLMPNANRAIIDQPLLLPSSDEAAASSKPQQLKEQSSASLQAKMAELSLNQQLQHQTSLIDSPSLSSKAATGSSSNGTIKAAMLYPYDASDNGYHSAVSGSMHHHHHNLFNGHHGQNFIEASSTTSSTSSTTPPSSLSSASNSANLASSSNDVNKFSTNASSNAAASGANNASGVNDLVYNYPKRKKETPPAKPPPPVLPKPKFILPQTTSNTAMALQRNLKSKSELNIAATTSGPCSLLSSASSSSSHSSTSSSSCHHGGGSDTATSSNNESNEMKGLVAAGSSSASSATLPPGSGRASLSNQTTASGSHLRNKLLENGSLVSASQGYHSDTWDSHSSRQSFDMESLPNNNQHQQSSANTTGPAAAVVTAATRYKHLNKLANKAAAAIESKIASVIGSKSSTNATAASTSLSSNSNSNMVMENLLSSEAGDSSSHGIGSSSSASSDDRDSTSPAQTSEHDYMQMPPPPLPNAPPPLPPSPPHASLKSSSILLEKPPISTSSCSTSSGSTSSSYFTNSSSKRSSSNINNNHQNGAVVTSSNSAAIELPIYYQTTTSNGQVQQQQLNSGSITGHEACNNSVGEMANSISSTISASEQQQQSLSKATGAGFKNYNSYSELYSNDAVKYRISTYTAHYNDNGLYRKLSLDSNSNCSIIASANGVFDHNGGILESADTGVSLTVPEGAISKGCTFDLYFKVCHCKSNITNGKGELLSNPIVMCGPRGIRFLKPIELQIPHFISIDGQSWSYAFKASENYSDEDGYNWPTNRFHKKTLLNSVTVLIDSF